MARETAPVLPSIRVALTALVLLAVGCRGDLGSPCTETNECRRGLTCWDANVFLQNANPDLGQCSVACDQASDCPSDGTCVDGLCALKCSGEDDPVCDEGTTCAGQWCVRTCHEQSDCGALSYCPVPGGICEPDPEA